MKVVGHDSSWPLIALAILWDSWEFRYDDCLTRTFTLTCVCNIDCRLGLVLLLGRYSATTYIVLYTT
jgi:hypothetical protein